MTYIMTYNRNGGHLSIWSILISLKRQAYDYGFRPHNPLLFFLPFCNYLWMKFFIFDFQRWNHRSITSHKTSKKLVKIWIYNQFFKENKKSSKSNTKYF